jgi:hypothetical protein
MKKQAMNAAKVLVFALSVIASVPAQAAYLDLNVGIVTHIYTYATFGDGDVGFRVQNPPATCVGFWFRMTDPGGKAVFAQILAAQQTQQPLRIGAYDDQLWTGSGDRWCRIASVGNP